jgi:hypothetical protein
MNNGSEDRSDGAPEAPKKRIFTLLMLGAAVLVVGACLVALRSRGEWALYLFIAAALVYVACRLGSVGMWSSGWGVAAIVLLFAGFLCVSHLSTNPVVKGIGIACFCGSGVCFFLFARARGQARMEEFLERQRNRPQSPGTGSR